MTPTRGCCGPRSSRILLHVLLSLLLLAITTLSTRNTVHDINDLLPWRSNSPENERQSEVKDTGIMKKWLNHYFFRGHNGMHWIPDSIPHYFQNTRDSTKSVVLCLPPKVASSELKQLLYRHALGPAIFDDFLMAAKDIHGEFSRHYFVPQQSIFDAVQDRTVPRIMITRNPYSKIFSAYNDKKAHEDLNDYLPDYDLTGNFTFLPEYLSWRLENGAQIDDHFRPLSTLCCIPDGFRYDYYLPLEELDLWYPGFLRLLGLEEDAATGWDRVRSATEGHVKSTCGAHYSSPVLECNQSVALHTTASLCALNQSEKLLQKSVSKAHELSKEYDHSSKSRNTTMVNFVDKGFESDFRLFRYQHWVPWSDNNEMITTFRRSLLTDVPCRSNTSAEGTGWW